jgi:hypothetical protein
MRTRTCTLKSKRGAWRAGQFGTRLQGGKDAASARYIFTRLEPITRVLFHEADDKLLAYLSEEGQSIEPQWCARPPVLVARHARVWLCMGPYIIVLAHPAR